MLRSRLAIYATGIATGVLVLTTAARGLAGLRSQEMPQPTAEHRHVLSEVGAWEGTVTMFVPGMPSEPVPAKQSIEAIGQFWTQTRFESNFMNMPYVGTGCTGYDPTKKKFVGTWIDNMSSFLSVMEGEQDPTTKAVTMRYHAPDMTGEIVPHRIVSLHKADGTSEMTFYAGEGASEMKTMVIAMKRAEAKPTEAKSVR